MSATQRTGGVAGGDEWIAILIVAAGLATVGVWGGAQLASLLHSRDTLPASPATGMAALVRLPSNMGDPAQAWGDPLASQLPGVVLYWLATGVVALVALAAGVGAYVAVTSMRIGTNRKARLGVEPQARLARRRDLKPLIVDGPTRGRFILGRVGHKLVATEDRHSQSAAAQRNRTRTRVGDRSAVVVVGPARCGKTANVTAGILDWETAAILSSVKDDLFTATIERRRQLGDVFVFDPFGELPEDLGEGVQRVGWSPLQAAVSISGAQQAANTLLDAGPTEGVTNANYWSTKGEQLLWPMLYAAAVANRSMGDVTRWMALQDGTEDDGGEVVAILSHMVCSGGVTGMEAQQALTAFTGFWKLDARTRSDIFSTAQTLITAWEDPYIAAASATAVQMATGELTRPAMDLARLLTANNTLYVVQPLKSVERFAVVFGGLLGDLLRDQAYEISKRAGQPVPPLLAVIDEAGNTPLRWMPQVASTCAGIGVQLVTVWQSLAQMKSIYQAQTDALLTNHGSKIFFSGLSDDTTLRYVSELGGEEEVTQHSATADTHWAGNRRSLAASTTRTKLLPADLLRQVPPGSALLLHGTLPPAHLVGRRPWEERRLVALTKGKAAVPAPGVLDDAMITALESDVTVPDYVLAYMGEVASRQRRELVKQTQRAFTASVDEVRRSPEAPAASAGGDDWPPFTDNDYGDTDTTEDDARQVPASVSKDPTPPVPAKPPPVEPDTQHQVAEVEAMLARLTRRPTIDVGRHRDGITRNPHN